jgi:hypothetical protein
VGQVVPPLSTLSEPGTNFRSWIPALALLLVSGCIDWSSLEELGPLPIVIEELTLEDGAVFDTTSLRLELPNETIELVELNLGSGGLPIAALSVGSLTIPVDSVVIAKGARPLLIMARGDMKILGLLDASGGLGLAGPGARTTGLGIGSPGVETRDVDIRLHTGSGGGGHVESGGNGGPSYLSGEDVDGPRGGDALSEKAWVHLFGGSNGGQAHPLCPGGGGGGGVYLTSSASITIGAEGGINVGGGGGDTGCLCAKVAAAGAGGGAGGTLILDAPRAVVDGRIAANGGGGGAGCAIADQSSSPFDALQGKDGDLSQEQAPAGIPSERSDAGRGGMGGAIANRPGDGEQGTQGGGGGGARGRIVLRASAIEVSDEAVISPDYDE